MADTVETAIYRLQVDGQDKIDRLTKSIDGLSTAVEPATGKTRVFSQTLQNMIGRTDEQVGGLNKIQKAWETYERYAEKGAGTQTQLAALMDITTKKVNEQAVALENMRRAQANAAEPRSSGSTVGINASAYAAEFDKLIEIAHLKAQQAGKNFQDTLNASFGNFSSGAAKSARDSFAAFEEAGMLPKANQGMVQLGNSTKVARYEMINLGRQANDVVVSLVSGQNLLMVAVQQGSQIWDVFTSSERKAVDILKQMGSGVASFVTNPIVLATAGMAALAATAAALALQYDKINVASQRAISGAGARTGTTTSDLNAFVDKNTPSVTSGASLSQKESRALAEGLTQTGDIVISKLHSMSDAVVGFSNQTGKSMDESVKAFVALGGDPKKAMDELAKAFGPFSQQTRDFVDAAVIAGDKTSAWNVILDSLGKTAKEAAENMTLAEKAGRGLANTLQTGPKPTGLETQLENVRQKLNQAISSAPDMLVPAEASKNIENLSREFEKLQARQQAVIDQKVASQFADVADKARVVTEALIPQIDQIKQAEAALNKLNAAQAQGGGGSDLSAAITAQQNVLQLTKESKDESARYNEQVAAIAQSWGNVGQATALALNDMQNALPVAEAWTNSGKMLAQYQATLNTHLAKGKTLEEASALAAGEYALSKAAAVASAQQLVQSSQDNLDKIRAQGTEMEGVVASSIAYRDAIQAGANATQAAAIAANVLEANLLQAAKAADQVAQSAQDAQMALVTQLGGQDAAAFGSYQSDKAFGGPNQGKQYTSVTDPLGLSNPFTNVNFRLNSDLITQIANTAYASGGLQGALAAVKGLPDATGATFTAPGYDVEQIFGPARSTIGDKISTVDALFNAQPGDKTANTNSEIAWLKANMPASVERDAKIAELTDAIDGLTTSTDSLNRTNSDLLSPYYTQDPRTSHIGFRSQGMASGGEFTVPGGYSANDNMLGTIPLASGEIVSVRRPGQSAGTTVNVVNNISVAAGADRTTVNAIGRTVYQSTQSAARSLRAASQ